MLVANAERAGIVARIRVFRGFGFEIRRSFSSGG